MKQNAKKGIVLALATVLTVSWVMPYGKDVLQEPKQKETSVKEYLVVSKGAQGMTYATYSLSETEASRWEKQKEILSVEENTILQASDEEHLEIDAQPACNWNTEAIGLEESGSETDVPSGNNKIKVALLDSGIEATEDIDVAGRINLVEEEQDIPEYFEDVTGHGTSIAGIMAANDKQKKYQGIHPDMELYSVRVLDSNNQSPVSRIIEGIYWCIDHDIDIINMSFGIERYSKALETAVQDADRAGILMVAAVGNSGGQVEYPAAYKEVLGVGSVNECGELSEFSSRGKELEITAPGENVRTAGYFGQEMIAEGTSIAVPHVTAAASVLWQKDRSKTKDFITELILQSSRQPEDENYSFLDLNYALEHYEEFEKGYMPGKEEIIEENTQELPSYEEEYAKARWNSAGHQAIVDTAGKDMAINAEELKAMKVYCLMPDWNRPDDDDHFRWHRTYLHGHDNYVANAKYLYEVAAKVRRLGKITSPQKITRSKMVEICQSVSYSSTVKDGALQKRAMMRAIKYICYDMDWNYYKKVKKNGKEVKTLAAPLTESIVKAESAMTTKSLQKTNVDYAARIMGLAIHLLGDVYSHKTIVPNGTSLYDETGKSIVDKNATVYKTFYKKDAEKDNWTDLKQVTGTGTGKKSITFVRLNRYLKDDVQNKYIDSINFYPMRYKVGACSALECVLIRYQYTPCTTCDMRDVFVRNSSDTKKYPELKLNCLKTYGEEVYGKGKADIFLTHTARDGEKEEDE